MSLINEALKRAEQDKSQYRRHIAPAIKSAENNMGEAAHSTKRLATMLVLIMALTVAVVWMMWRFSPNGGPQHAEAIPTTAVAPPQPTGLPNAATRPVNITQKNVPSSSRRSETPSASAEQLTVAAELAALAKKAHQDTTAFNTNTPATKPAEPVTSKPVVRPADVSVYKLSGIMHGPNGPIAIINGSPLQVGQTIGEAKITKIGHDEVSLEIRGRTYTIGM